MEKEKKRESPKHGQSPRLPFDIVLEILLRLPVKSLSRFKSVSKQWRSGISDAHFEERHRIRATERYGIIIESEFRGSPSSLYWLGSESSLVKIDRPWHSSSFCYDDILMGSCNGLLLLGLKNGNICLWNPSTAEFRSLDVGLYSDPSMTGCFMYGLGYDSSTEDFKAVLIRHQLSPPGSPGPDGFNGYEAYHVLVMSFKTNSRIKVEDFPYRTFSDCVATSLNGAPHWAVRCDTGFDEGRFSLNWLIIYFDPVENKFKEVAQPDYGVENIVFGRLDLGILRGWLSIFRTCRGSSTVEIWAMKEYGAKESWTHLFVISFLEEDLKPLCFTSTGEVVMVRNRKELVVCDPERKTRRKITAPKSKYECHFVAVPYVASFLPPPALQMTWGRDCRHGNN